MKNSGASTGSTPLSVAGLPSRHDGHLKRLQGQRPIFLARPIQSVADCRTGPPQHVGIYVTEGGE
jgi:hypothetical protein